MAAAKPLPAALAPPSPALLEANQQLYELRKRAHIGQVLTVGLEQPLANGSQQPTTSRQGSPLPDNVLPIARLPQHLGWESSPVSAALRAIQERRNWVETVFDPTHPEEPTKRPAAEAPASKERQLETGTVKLYPDIALGMLHKELAAAGRIWLLLRHLDQDGQGWLRIDLIRSKLTSKNSSLCVCGRRQLRNLLRQGRGVFWEQDKERIWLKAAGRVAVALDVTRLSGRPIELPVEALLGGIGQVRAHFYASFHSGRRLRSEGASGNPISRATLEKITHVPERTQRVYEQKTHTVARRNIAIGRRQSTKEVQERAWKHGRATFEFIDKHGKQGPAGRHYVAWRLPNSYQGCHNQCPKGRQKKINQEIDLVNSVARGNGRGREVSRREVGRFFHPSGLAAARAFSRDGQTDAYWQGLSSRNGKPRMWQVIPGSRKR